MYTKKTLCAVLTALLLGVAGSLHAQEKISLKLDGATLREAFSAVEKESGYSFFYDAQSLDLTARVTADIKDAGIEETLKAILSGTGVKWSVKGKQIALIPPPHGL